MHPTKVPLIGLVGGIASGKSYIAEQFERRGAAVVSADALAHDVLRQADVKDAVRKRWGDRVMTSEGEVDRAALGRVVFAPQPDGPRELKHLEGITHPRIGPMALEAIARLREQGSAVAIVLDVPLMLEAGWNKFCDHMVFVDAPRPLRLARAMARGWTKEEFTRREAAQESLLAKQKLADVVIDNSQAGESLETQIERVWPRLVDAAPENRS
jgi:dephospho-CoA kinase